MYEREKLLGHEDAKFKAGDMVMAKNGRGSCYMVCWVEDFNATFRFEETENLQYYLDNGSVHVQKRAKSGYNSVERVDRGYKKVS